MCENGPVQAHSRCTVDAGRNGLPGTHMTFGTLLLPSPWVSPCPCLWFQKIRLRVLKNHTARHTNMKQYLIHNFNTFLQCLYITVETERERGSKREWKREKKRESLFSITVYVHRQLSLNFTSRGVRTVSHYIALASHKNKQQKSSLSVNIQDTMILTFSYRNSMN